MDDRFTEEELHSLVLKRRWLFIGFPVIVILLFFLAWITCYYVLHIDGETIAGLFSFVGLFLPPFAFLYCLSKYKESVRKTAYFLITQHYNWRLLHSKEDISFEKTATEFGLLRENEYIEPQNLFLQGEKDRHTFTLQDISWMAIRGSQAARGPVTKAQYTLLTVPLNDPIPCKILIKKNRLFKWGIKNLERLKLQDKEFEKLYDVYTDRPNKTTSLLQRGFIQALVAVCSRHQKGMELIITHKKIFVLYNTGIWGKLFGPVIFRHPRVQCEEIFKEINDMLDILSILSLLENPRA
jgi:hypothetical protein